MTLAKNGGNVRPSLQARAFNTDQLSVISAKFEGLRPFEKSLLIWRSLVFFCPKVGPSMIRGLLETTFQLVSQTVKR